MRYVALLRGINVGGRNKVPMAGLREALSEDFARVRTYIQSGNVVLESSEPAAVLAAHIERLLPSAFDLDSELIRVLVLDRDSYDRVVAEAPPGFGSDNETYRYDVGFFVGIGAADIEPHVPTHPDVDVVTWGQHAFYHRRLIALASRSRVNQVVGSPAYASLTIRNWRTTTRIAGMLAED